MSFERSEELARLRKEYEETGIEPADLDPDPLEAFDTWFTQAQEAGCTEPNAMVVSTVDAAGRPSARNLLLKGLDRPGDSPDGQTGFIFYTNYASNKGRDIDATSLAALTFSWLQLHRQVRVSGHCERVADATSDAYFALRPRGSQLGAWASEQSQPVADRSVMEQRFADLEAEWDGREVTRPPHWGGYRVEPSRIEFWQGRLNRMHDRILYEQSNDDWSRTRLNP